MGLGIVRLELQRVLELLHGLFKSLEAQERVLSRVAATEVADYFAQTHQQQGVDLRWGVGVTGFEGNGKLRAVMCGDQRVPADVAVIGIGVVPNVELAEAIGLACDNGIKVDERCRTEDEHIYAAGDCTNHPNPLLERRLRLESVPNAIAQGQTAAANVFGQDKVYAEVPWFWSDQYQLKLQMAGLADDFDQSVRRDGEKPDSFAVFYLRQGVLIAVEVLMEERL